MCERFNFNTAIAAVMELVNEIDAGQARRGGARLGALRAEHGGVAAVAVRAARLGRRLPPADGRARVGAAVAGRRPGAARGRHVRARLPGQRQGPRPRARADRRVARRAAGARAGRRRRCSRTSTATTSSRRSSCPTSSSTSSCGEPAAAAASPQRRLASSVTFTRPERAQPRLGAHGAEGDRAPGSRSARTFGGRRRVGPAGALGLAVLASSGRTGPT